MANIITTHPTMVGAYFKYKGTNMVAVESIGHSGVLKYKLLDPTDNTKVVVKASNVDLEMLDITPMVHVNRCGAHYLRSVKGLLISLKTGRVMKWSDTNGNRKAILQAV